MAQVSLYVEDDLMKELRAEAKKEGVSLSHYVGEVLRTRGERAGWPKDFFELYGSVEPDFEEEA